MSVVPGNRQIFLVRRKWSGYFETYDPRRRLPLSPPAACPGLQGAHTAAPTPSRSRVLFGGSARLILPLSPELHSGLFRQLLVDLQWQAALYGGGWVMPP